MRLPVKRSSAPLGSSTQGECAMAMWCELRFSSTRNLEGRQQMGDSIPALFKRLTQGVYVVGVAHGEMRMALLRFY